MKTTEDKLNEALRNVLKRKFDDYEERPDPDALDRIRARVKPARSWKYWWFAGALLLISGSGIVLNRYVNDDAAPAGIRENIAAKAPEKTKTVISSPAEIPANAPVSEAQRVSQLSTSEKALKERTMAAIPNAPARGKGIFINKSVNKVRAGVHQVPSGNDGGATGGGTAQFEHADPGMQLDASNVEAAPDIAAALADEIAAQADPAVHIAPLEELAAMPRTEAGIPLQLRGVAVPAYKPAKVIVTNPAKVAWLLNASVLHSYQILTVPSSAAKDFQNFSFPSLFTARSLGYKLSGGVERNGIQLQLHFNSFKQTYSYEVANNNYLVKPDDKGQYQTVRQGDRMEENRQFSMLGISLARQFRWGHSPVSRFYATFGAEYSRDLSSSRSLGWINLGLGKQFAVSRNTAFSIGPYAEFSPVKVRGTANPFYYQPYRVGISAGLRFVRP